MKQVKLLLLFLLSISSHGYGEQAVIPLAEPLVITINNVIAEGISFYVENNMLDLTHLENHESRAIEHFVTISIIYADTLRTINVHDLPDSTFFVEEDINGNLLLRGQNGVITHP